MRLFLKNSVLVLNFVIAVFLLFSHFSAYISPDFIPLLAILGLSYPLFLIINIIFIIFWAVKLDKNVFVSIVSIAITYVSVAKIFAFGIVAQPDYEARTIKVLSYNVRMFNLYNWVDDADAGQEIFRYIKNQNADIICLQEYYSDSDKHNFQDSIISSQRSLNYIVSSGNKKKYSGNAIFSRYPIVSSGFVNIGTAKQKCIYADIKIDDDTLRVYSVHLASIHLDKADYEALDNLENDKSDGKIVSIGAKMIKAYKTRARETELIKDFINNDNSNVIVCGDFNDIPISYSYNNIKGDLKDVFLEAGFGFGGTYHTLATSIRIDYIFCSPNLFPVNFEIGNIDFSDHYPISSEIVLPKKKLSDSNIFKSLKYF